MMSYSHTFYGQSGEPYLFFSYSLAEALPTSAGVYMFLSHSVF